MLSPQLRLLPLQVGELLMGFKCFLRFQWDPQQEIFLTLMNTFSSERQIGKIVSYFAKTLLGQNLTINPN